jgi:SAM-dependent methyltransferase
MWSVAGRNAAVQAFQRLEIERIAADPAFRQRHGAGTHYSRIAVWPGAKPGNRVLELGCGPGRYAAFLAGLGCRVIAVDPFAFDTWSLIRPHQFVTFVPGVKAEALPFRDHAFDAVTCLGALLYFGDADQALDEMFRVLRPGGHLLIRTISAGNLFRRIRGRDIDPATRRVFEVAQLEALVERHGFSVANSLSYGVYSPVLPAFWWYLMNGVLSVRVQEFLSAVTPSAFRTNIVVLAQRSR